MNEAGGNSTQAVYCDQDRSRIREFVQKEAKRRKVDTDAVDFDALWQALENAANQYDKNRDFSKPKTALKETLAKLDAAIDAIRILIGEDGLLNPSVLAWSFISDSGASVKNELPITRTRLVRDLQNLETKLTGEVERLQTIAAGKDLCVLGRDERLLQSNMLKIGHRLLGPQIGKEQGPLMTFMQLVLRPVLGDATPDRAAMRTFARREGGHPD
jgi:hypothetical protein